MFDEIKHPKKMSEANFWDYIKERNRAGCLGMPLLYLIKKFCQRRTLYSYRNASIRNRMGKDTVPVPIKYSYKNLFGSGPEPDVNFFNIIPIIFRLQKKDRLDKRQMRIPLGEIAGQSPRGYLNVFGE